MPNITLQQFGKNIDILYSLCSEYEIDISNVKIFGRILGPSGYQGRQRDINLIIDEFDSKRLVLSRNRFERSLSDILCDRDIFYSLEIVTYSQLEYNLTSEEYDRIIKGSVYICDL